MCVGSCSGTEGWEDESKRKHEPETTCDVFNALERRNYQLMRYIDYVKSL